MHSIIERARKLPPRILIPSGLAVAVLVLAIARGIHGGAPTPAQPVAPVPAQQPAVPLAVTPAPVAPASATTVSAEAVAAAPRPALAATAALAEVMPPAAVAPPPGLVAGRLAVERLGIDQFGRQVTISHGVAAADRFGWTAPRGVGQAIKQYKLVGWIHLAAPATLARVLIAGDTYAKAGLTVDSRQVIADSEHGGEAAVTVGTGWHVVQFTYSPWAGGGAVELDLGDQDGEIASPTPWAVDPGAAPASSSTASAPAASVAAKQQVAK